MYKKNYKETVERNKLFLKRKLMDGILFKAVNIRNYPGTANESRDEEWKTRECLLVSDREWVIENTRRQASVYLDVDDDTITQGYPTLHAGESLYSAMLGGEIQFVGTASHTCSGAKPLIKDEDDLHKLKIDENNQWIRVFKESATYFAKETRGDFWLSYFITIDAMNLAVELLGTPEAYIVIYENEKLLREIMDFGVEYNIWFYMLQKKLFEENNRKALGDDELYDLYDKTWYSIDAYNLCSPEIYDKFGFEYQQRLISAVGGGLLHTHGTGILNLLPKVARLKDIGVIQAGRDLTPGTGKELGMEYFHWFREITGDIPLQINLSKEEFINGLEKQSLPTGVQYVCTVPDIEEASRLAYKAKEYRRPRQI